jgi:hypothetical protein
MNKVLNKVLKINEKTETITVQAQSEAMAEILAYRTHVFNQCHETELTDYETLSTSSELHKMQKELKELKTK